jgi:hypothetical protein
MELSFAALEEGRVLYRVVRQGQVVFTGAREECVRFLTIRREKERREVERVPCDPCPPERRA